MAAVWMVRHNCSASPRLPAIASVTGMSLEFGVGFAAFGLWMVTPMVNIDVVALTGRVVAR